MTVQPATLALTPEQTQALDIAGALAAAGIPVFVAAPDPSKPTALYRVYDQEGVLLYVGITNHLGQRLAQHCRESVWWRYRNLADHVRVAWQPRESAGRAEIEAIDCERPIFNKRRRKSGWTQRRREYLDAHRQEATR